MFEFGRLGPGEDEVCEAEKRQHSHRKGRVGSIAALFIVATTFFLYSS